MYLWKPVLINNRLLCTSLEVSSSREGLLFAGAAEGNGLYVTLVPSQPALCLELVEQRLCYHPGSSQTFPSFSYLNQLWEKLFSPGKGKKVHFSV